MSAWLDRPRGLLTHGGWIVLLALSVVGAFQVFALGRNGRSPERLPQLVRGDDALAVAFGGARETISLAMVHKADSYFHGGVDIECTLDHEHDEGCEHGHDDGCDHDNHSPGPETQASERPGASFPDPWAWINRHIRAPEVERHLEGRKAVELMPWLWASVRSDPHNIDAWTTAIYIAYNVMKDRALASRVVAEGRAKNPGSLELLLAEGRLLYDRGAGDVSRARQVFASVRDTALGRCGGKVEELPEKDLWAYRFALNFLKDADRRQEGR